MTKRKALTIAGSDTSGGAGIQADLKTFQELGVYGMNALTVIVAQDPDHSWHHAVYPIDTELVRTQIHTVLGGIGVDAMKTGMLPTVWKSLKPLPKRSNQPASKTSSSILLWSVKARMRC